MPFSLFSYPCLNFLLGVLGQVPLVFPEPVQDFPTFHPCSAALHGIPLGVHWVCAF